MRTIDSLKSRVDSFSHSKGFFHQKNPKKMLKSNIMNKDNNNETKKILANQLKDKLNSPEYRYNEMLPFLVGVDKDGNIHKEENWIYGDNINPEKGNKYNNNEVKSFEKTVQESKNTVCYNELEKEDWEEIVNLIKKRNQEKKQAFEAEKKHGEIYNHLENGEKLLVAKGDEHRPKNTSNSDNKLMAVGTSPETNQSKNELSAVAKKETKPSEAENQQLAQITHAIERLELRIAELEKNGGNSQQIQTLKSEVKVLESQKQKQLNKNKQNQVGDHSIEVNKPTSNQAENQSKNTGHILLVIGGLLVVGVALVIGYLLGKDKKVDK
jgi:hypothetical protein